MAERIDVTLNNDEIDMIKDILFGGAQDIGTERNSILLKLNNAASSLIMQNNSPLSRFTVDNATK